VLTLKDVSQSYDGKRKVYEDLNLTLERGQRIALVGPNGAGKSTLVKLLAGQIPILMGERREGYGVEVGYFSQHRAEMFRPGKTALEEAINTKRGRSEQSVRTVLGSFLFRGDSVFKKVDVLSGGEKSRLALARLLLDPPNLLLLDEPTTHLDMASVDVLLKALKGFEGTLVFISHDVYFIRQLATHIIHVNQGKVTWYPGDYDYFLHKKSQDEGEEAELFRSEERIEAEHHHHLAPAEPQTTRPGKKTKEQKRLEAEERNARYRAAQEQKKVQGARDKLKEEQAALFTEMSYPATHQNPARVVEITRRLGELEKELRGLL
jgi:ATP-binding cassette, subfamily F, member 3